MKNRLDSNPWADPQSPRHPIEVVSRRTGLTPDVLRAWEKRYRAIEPGRSPGRRRLYSDSDVRRLVLLRRAIAAGRRIGDVAKLPTPELESIIREDESSLSDSTSRSTASSVKVQGAAAPHFRACMDAVKRLDADALETRLVAASVDLSVPVLLEEVLVPLLKEVGEGWARGALRTCHEHLATAQIRSFLAGLRLATALADSAPAVVVTTPAGQYHELGALMAAATAAMEGWSVIYLGPNLPAAEIASAVVQRGARALALSVVYPADDPSLAEELRQIRRSLPEGLPILVGGQAAESYQAAIEASGSVLVRELDAFRSRLHALRRPSLR